jgi:hypothetical protein
MWLVTAIMIAILMVMGIVLMAIVRKRLVWIL